MKKDDRDNFTPSVRLKLIASVRGECSICHNNTVFCSDPNVSPTIIGHAAHICAAAANGPRYDENMTDKDRSSYENGIWLCLSCHTKIDDPNRLKEFTVEHLKDLKRKAVEKAIEEHTNDVQNNSTKYDKKIRKEFYKIYHQYGIYKFLHWNERIITIDEICNYSCFSDEVINVLSSFIKECGNCESDIFINIQKFLDIYDEYYQRVGHIFEVDTHNPSIHILNNERNIAHFILLNYVSREALFAINYAIRNSSLISEENEKILNYEMTLKKMDKKDFDPVKIVKDKRNRDMFLKYYHPLMEFISD